MKIMKNVFSLNSCKSGILQAEKYCKNTDGNIMTNGFSKMKKGVFLMSALDPFAINSAPSIHAIAYLSFSLATELVYFLPIYLVASLINVY